MVFAYYLLKNKALAKLCHCCFIHTTDKGFRGPLQTVIDSRVKLLRAARGGLFPCGFNWL